MEKRSIPQGIRAAVLDRDGYKCSYCGSIDNLSIDHIIPIAKGGTSIIENLRTLCLQCNLSKGSGDRPRTISGEKYEVRHIGSVLSHLKGDWFTMTRDELAKALEEYPQKLREALLRQYLASEKIEDARSDVRVTRYNYIRDDDDFIVGRAKIAHSIRTNPSAYGLSSKPNDSAIQDALLASDEYTQLRSKLKESHSDNTYTRDASISKAREEKELADIEVEVLQKTLETYRILAGIMKLEPEAAS